MKIKRKNGHIVEVDNAYILGDGESFTVGLMMMDSTWRVAMITDGRGNPAGCRPGFLYADSNETALEAAHREYREDIEQRWRQGPGQPSSPKQAEPQTFESPEAAREHAYAQYRRDIEERWRK